MIRRCRFATLLLALAASVVTLGALRRRRVPPAMTGLAPGRMRSPPRAPCSGHAGARAQRGPVRRRRHGHHHDYRGAHPRGAAERPQRRGQLARLRAAAFLALSKPTPPTSRRPGLRADDERDDDRHQDQRRCVASTPASRTVIRTGPPCRAGAAHAAGTRRAAGARHGRGQHRGGSRTRRPLPATRTPRARWEADADRPAGATVPDIAAQLIERFGSGGHRAGRTQRCARRRAREIPFARRSARSPSERGAHGARRDGSRPHARMDTQVRGQYVFDRAGFDAIDPARTTHLLGLFEARTWNTRPIAPRTRAASPRWPK